jgi:hypothetical protein
MNTETKRCTKCYNIQPIGNYYLKLGKPRTACKKCQSKEAVENPNHKLHNKRYYENNREYHIQQVKLRQAKNKMENAIICVSAF